MTERRTLLLLACLLLLPACGDEAAPTSDAVPLDDENNALPDDPNNDPVGCVPDERMWDFVVSDMVDVACGECHGEAPDFGAPYSLVDYDALIEGVEGERIVDRIVVRMDEDTMPPATSRRPSHVQRDTIVEWASCGLVHPDETVGLEVSRDVFPEPADLPPDTTTVDLVAEDFEVAPTTIDLYQCFIFPSPVDEDRFVKRIEPVVDESRVLHHLVLMEAPGELDEPTSSACGATFGRIVYAWAPGGGAIQFPDGGGMRVSPGMRYILQVHYNNGAGIEDVKDNSGVRFYLGDMDGPEYSLLSTGSGIPEMSIEPGERAESTETCTMTRDATFLTGFPHMHETGSEFHETIERVDGSQEQLIDLTGWRFEAQFFYELPVSVSRGDEITTTCIFENLTDKPVRGGLRTEDEMCFDFIYATPPGASCN